MNHMKAEHSRVPSVISMIEACKNKKKRELAKKSERDSKKVRNQRTQPRITAFAKSRGVMDAFKEKRKRKVIDCASYVLNHLLRIHDTR